jgi:hypothetical protein
VVTAHGNVFLHVSPLVGATVREAYPDIASGGQVTVTDSSGRRIGTGTLTDCPDPGQAAANLKTATAGSGPTASELTASGAVYDFTVTVPWLVRYGITVGRQETLYFTAAQISAPLVVFSLTFRASGFGFRAN